MDEERYKDKFYNCKASCCDDTIKVYKTIKSFHVEITMKIHNEIVVSLPLRSKEQAEQLHFMLGQLLEK